MAAQLGIRGATGRPPPTFPSGDAPPPAPARASGPAHEFVPEPPEPRKTFRQKTGTALLLLGLFLFGLGWLTAERDPQRGLLMNLGAKTKLVQPVCACDGHAPKIGGCARAGYLGASCSELGFELTPPLAAPLLGGLALCALGAAMMRRRDEDEDEDDSPNTKLENLLR